MYLPLESSPPPDLGDVKLVQKIESSDNHHQYFSWGITHD